MKRGLVLFVLALPTFAQGQVAPIWFPEVVQIARPEWIQPGMRLTYFTASATIRQKRVKHPDGQIRLENGGSGGMGYMLVDVVAVGPKAIAVNTRFYLLPDAREGGPTRLGKQLGAVGPPGSVEDFWVHPRALANAEIGTRKGDGGSTNILRSIQTANKKKYHATRVDTTASNTQRSHVWDNRSGVLLFTSSVTQLPAQSYYTAGKSTGHMEYRSARQLKVPWVKSPMPGWLNRVKKMEFLGIATLSHPGGPPVETPRAMRYEFIERGPNWTKIKVTSVGGGLRDLDPGTAGLMEGTSRSEMSLCTGPGTIGGAWIPPAGLTTLKAGQVLDRDPYTKFTTTVAHAGMVDGRNVVVIVEENSKQRIEFQYDARSGGLLRVRLLDKDFHTDAFLRLNNTK